MNNYILSSLMIILTACGTQEDFKSTGELAGLGRDGIKTDVALISTDRTINQIEATVFGCDATDYEFHSSTAHQLTAEDGLFITLPKENDAGCNVRFNMLKVDGLEYVPAKDTDWSADQITMEHHVKILDWTVADSVVILNKLDRFSFNMK